MCTHPNQPVVERQNENVIVGGSILGGGIEVPAEAVDKEFWQRVLLYQFLYSLSGLASGLVSLLGGVLLFLNGIVGEGKWTADFFGVTISDAAPGIVLFVVGVSLAQLSKFTVRIAPKKNQTDA